MKKDKKSQKSQKRRKRKKVFGKDTRRVFSPDLKMTIICDYLKRGVEKESVESICHRYGVTREHIRNWYNRLKTNAEMAFSATSRKRNLDNLEIENLRLRERIEILERQLNPDYDFDELGD